MIDKLRMPRLPKLPIGEQSFRTIREDSYLYIDKTALVLQLIQEGRSYFLSRPRRMGKSLLVSLLKELFEGHRELFEGLSIAESGYDFQPYPVIRLDFGLIAARSFELFMSGLCRELRRIASVAGLGELRETTPDEMFAHIVQTLAERAPVVLLIDEYDMPLLGKLEDPEKAQPYIDFLKDFYAAVKALQPYLRFTFITGVSRFSRTSMFSGMNHLKDLSLQIRYAALLGVTEDEITRELLPAVRHIAEKQQKSEEEVRDLMRRWYNGYRFSAEPTAPSVYNPHSLFSFLEEGVLDNYWFETGTPSFAINLIRRETFPVEDIEKGLQVPSSILKESVQCGHISITALLFQTGYLTIRSYDPDSREYTLHFPNEEVRCSFFQCLMGLFFNASSDQTRYRIQEITQGLRAGDVQPIITAVNLRLGQLSHQLQPKDEAYYHSMIFFMLRTIGYAVETEKSGCTGRLDMGLRIDNKAYIFEFKRDSSAAEAIRQIHDKHYARAYAGEGLHIYLVGINVNSKSCSIDDWVVEQIVTT